MSEQLDAMRTAWQCKIGIPEGVEVPPGGDWPMRQATEKAFRELTGKDATACFSGWGAKFTPSEIGVINNQSIPEPPPLALDPLDLGAVFEYYWTAEWSKDLRDDIDNGKAYGPEDIKTVARYTWEAARKVLPAAPPQEPAAPGGKLIRDLIRAHKHNVTRKLWADLNPAQQESWDDVAKNFLKAMKAPAPPQPQEGGASEGSKFCAWWIAYSEAKPKVSRHTVAVAAWEAALRGRPALDERSESGEASDPAPNPSPAIPPRADPGRECEVIWRYGEPFGLVANLGKMKGLHGAEVVRMVEPPHAGGRDLALYENPEGYPCPKCKQTHNHFHERAGGAPRQEEGKA